MLSVRLLTQGADGNVVADGVFDPPAGAVMRPDPVPPARLPLEARGATAMLSSPRAVPAFMAPDHAGTVRREAAVDSVFLVALNGGFEAAAPLAPSDSLFARPARELTSPSKLLAIGPVAGSAPGRAAAPVPLDRTGTALDFQTLTIVDTSNSAILGAALVDVLAKTGGGGGP
jgi:hypothetical protein